MFCPGPDPGRVHPVQVLPSGRFRFSIHCADNPISTIERVHISKQTNINIVVLVPLYLLDGGVSIERE